MFARKQNKVYDIETDSEKKAYLNDGYDIYEDGGELLENSPKSVIAKSDYDEVVKENEKLKEKLKKLKKGEKEAKTESTVEN